ncbi:hypothetical protein HIM_06810 [Hirsutella minnesotensis 3608]|uniref:Uncharacterized protein n=1 Tax=Hirsutella minnesotensis 3608 TaxID=1043627 RepID=A0A0F7ZZ67_9HYPO|nr:hypothetical protein HIM_06810 [Hirsutella minnesotensis 3608]
MLLSQFLATAFLAMGTVSALPQVNPEGAVEVRDIEGMEGDLAARADLEARRRRCPKKYHRHEGKCCRRHTLRRTYYDCHPW